MLFFAFPFLLSFGTTVFSTFYFQRKFSSKADNIQIETFSGKLQGASIKHLLLVYSTAIAVGLPVCALFLVIPGLGATASIGFIVGLLSALLILHTSFLFLIKLDSKFIDRSSYGLIQSFNLIFGGGNMLGVFLLSSALFVVTVYHITLGPSSIGLMALGLGVSFVATLFKLYQATFLGSDEDSTRDLLSKDLPEGLARVHILSSVTSLADVLETFFLALVVSILGASLFFPGFAGAVALPLLAGMAGIISAALSTKFIHVGATTNITKNILFSFLGAIILSVVVVFPLIAWTMNENVQYSNIVLWLSVVTGLSILFFTFASHYNNILRKLLKKLYPSVIALFFAISFGVSYFIAGPYGLALLIVSALSLGGIIVSLGILRSVSWSSQFTAKYIDLPEERRKIMKKLSSISNHLSGDVNVYMLLVTILLISGIFVMYQKQAEYTLAQINMSLSNPSVGTGIFVGIAAVFIFIKSLSRIAENKSLPVKVEDDANIGEKSGKFKEVFFDTNNLQVSRMLAGLAVTIYLAPLSLIWIFNVEFFSGFFYGAVVSAVVFSIISSMDNKKSSSFDTGIQDPYSVITGAVLLSVLKTLGAASLLTVIFII